MKYFRNIIEIYIYEFKSSHFLLLNVSTFLAVICIRVIGNVNSLCSRCSLGRGGDLDLVLSIEAIVCRVSPTPSCHKFPALAYSFRNYLINYPPYIWGPKWKTFCFYWYPYSFSFLTSRQICYCVNNCRICPFLFFVIYQLIYYLFI